MLSLYQIMGVVDVMGEPELWSRVDTCFCGECNKGNFSECLSKDEIGVWTKRKLQLLSLTQEQKSRYIPVSLSVREQQLKDFFSGPALDANTSPIIVAFMKHQGLQKSVVWSIMCKAPKRLTKKLIYSGDGGDDNNSAIEFKVKDLVIYVKFLSLCPNALNQFYIEVGSKERPMLVSSIVFPENIDGTDRNNYIEFVTQPSIEIRMRNGRSHKRVIYELSQSSIDSFENLVEDTAYNADEN
jgi:hypothetical protein